MTDEDMEQWTSARVNAIRNRIDRMNDGELRAYLKDIVYYLVSACADAGATDWPAELHLGDVIEKHLMRAVVIPADAKPSGGEEERP